LDLRRERMQRNMALRTQMVGVIRGVMDEAGYLEIQTPILGKPTPEGARDFLVPSRLQPGLFYALPQSPQLYKQLLMVSGFDRYYQIAVCFRDEDLRADRLQEITQLDVELAFPDQEELFALMERMIRAVWRECIGVEIPAPFERMSWDEAQRCYGSDKPDLRFGLEIEDATEVTRGSGFGVFAKADCVRFLRVPQAFSRAEQAALEELAKEWGAGGLAYIVYGDEGEARSPILKFLSEPELAQFRSEPGSTVLFGAGDEKGVARVLGQLRLELGERLALVDAEAWRFLWITDFPLLEWDADAERWDAVHHPFTRPAAADEELLEPGAARAHAYDLVANGVEIGGGSFRIHEPQLQQRIFDLLRISPEEQRAKFGFLLDALSMGAPPHGGIAFGIERMLMVLGREQNLRDTQAFPKNQAGIDPMTGAPSEALPEHLRELGIRLARPPR
ncbi:MAG: aspartate--tRNA ligase, partial [Gaiellaceae bacterium]